MKKISLLILTIVCILLLFCSCNREDATEGLTYRLQDDGTYYVSAGEGTSQLSEIVIPMWHKGRLVSGVSTFYGNTNLTYLYIPSSVKVIESAAFMGCSSLTEIKFPSGLEIIGKSAFEKCSSLERIETSRGDLHIQERAFKDCEALKEVKLSDGILEIGEEAFSGCTSLTSFRVPKTVKSLGKNAFLNSSNITKFELLGPQIIPDDTFGGFDSLTEIYFGDSVKYIGTNFKYAYNKKLRDVRLPSKVEYISPYAFSDIPLLNYNDFGGGRYIGNEKNPYIFLVRKFPGSDGSLQIHPNCLAISCNALEGVEHPILPKGMTSVPFMSVLAKDYHLYNDYVGCIYLGTEDNPYYMLIKCHGYGDLIKVHPDCEVISADAFATVAPVRLYIPAKVRSFGGGVLKNSNIEKFEVDPANKYFKSVDGMLLSKDGRTLLRVAPAASGSITVPTGVTTIGDYAFGGCKKVDQVLIPSGVKTVGRSAFEGIANLEKIHIPASLETIGEGAFKNSGLKWVVYGGSDEKFKNIEFYCGNDPIKRAELKDE